MPSLSLPDDTIPIHLQICPSREALPCVRLLQVLHHSHDSLWPHAYDNVLTSDSCPILMDVQTWVGSTACLVFGFLAAIAYVQSAAFKGLLQPQQLFSTIAAKSAVVSLASAAAESLPVGDWDNVVISFVAAGSARLLYGC